MPTLFTTLIAQQLPAANVQAQALFDTGVLPEGLASKVDGVGSVPDTFGFAFAEAVARTAVQRLSQGESLKSVSTKMGVALAALPTEKIAYVLSAFQGEIAREDLATSFEPISQITYSAHGRSTLNTSTKITIVQSLALAAPSVTQHAVMGVVTEAWSGLDLHQGVAHVRDKSLNDTSRNSGSFLFYDAVFETHKNPALPILAFLEAPFRDISLRNADRLFRGKEVGSETLPRPLEATKDGEDVDAVGVIDTAFRYAMVETMTTRAAQALAEGMPVEKVGQVLGETLVPMGVPVVYGIDRLRLLVTTHESSALEAYRETHGDEVVLTKTFQQDLLKGLSPSFYNPDSVGLIESVLQNKDKGADLDVFNRAVETVALEQASQAPVAPAARNVLAV